MTNLALMPQRPPYVEFEERPEEDRNETIKQGKVVLKAVDYAIIRPIGGKDAVEKPALPWLEHIEKQAVSGDYPREWAKFFRDQYQGWKNGQEVQPNGMHVRNWAAIGRTQAEMLVAARVLTVEDLAQANEEALGRIGIGARELQNRARAWLQTAAQNGSAEELAALRVKTESQAAENKELRQRLDALEARLAVSEDDAGGRKRRA